MSATDFEKEICIFLKEEYKFNIEEACFSTGIMPKYILLDRTRNIHSYFVFCQNIDGCLHSTVWKDQNELDNNMLILIKKQFSELDRPLFFVIGEKAGGLKIIEGNFIREFLLERKPDISLLEFIVTNAQPFNDFVSQIRKEL